MNKTVKAVFLDRDGVINKYPGNFEYVKSWEEFEFLPNIKPALKKLRDKGYELFVISNQAGVAKGLYSQETLDLITRNMLKELAAAGIDISGVYYCTHHPDAGCSCRKPKAGLVLKAIETLQKNGLTIEIGRSYFIGDSERDVETGRSAGLKTILLFSGRERPENRSIWQALPDYTAGDLGEAVGIITGENNGR